MKLFEYFLRHTWDYSNEAFDFLLQFRLGHQLFVTKFILACFPFLKRKLGSQYPVCVFVYRPLSMF
jgi:hypothetical protein